MKVVLDTNVLFSIIVYPSQKLGSLYNHLQEEHEVIVFDYVVDELISVTTRKRPAAMNSVLEFLDTISVQTTAENNQIAAMTIRDVKDQPILDAAIIIDADILLTGDKDFHELGIGRPRIMTPGEFFNEFMQNHD